MVKSGKTASLLTCLFLSQLNVSNSQEIASLQLSEADFFTDFPVVLTATRLKQPQKNSPIATTVIDREMIEASGFTEIADILRLAPGMLVNYNGNLPVVGYQFLYDEYRVRMQVLVDGRSVYTPILGIMNWSQLGITLDDIERIEVIRGPSSSSYGPNAAVGVVSIITRHASLDKGTKITANIGSRGLREAFVKYGDSAGKLDYKLSMANKQSEGFKDRYDDSDISILNFRGDYLLGNKDQLTFHLNYNSSELGDDAPFSDWSHPDHDREIDTQSQQVKWTRTVDDKNEFVLKYYHQKYEDSNHYLSDPVPAEPDFFDIVGDRIFVNEDITSIRKNLEFSHTYYGEKLNLSWGGTYRKDKTMAPHYLYQSQIDSVTTKQLFLNTEYAITPDNILNFGVVYDDSDTSDTTTSPRIAFNHHVNKNHTLRISYSKSTRSPFIFEEYTNYYIPGFSTPPSVLPIPDRFPWVDYRDLDPERITSAEIGYFAVLNNNKTEIDLRYYENEISDIIFFYFNENPAILTAELLAADGIFFDNLDAFKQSGFEVSISHKFNKSRVIFNYAHTNIVGETEVTYDEYQSGAPKDVASLLAIHDFSDSLTGSLGFYYTGKFKQLSSSVQQDVRRRLGYASFSMEF